MADRAALNAHRRTVPQLLAAAANDSDAASVFYNGSGPTDYDGAVVVLKGRENVEYVVAMLARQQLLTVDKPVECWCHTCRPLGPDRMEMVLCPDCGNKRCPKANDHRNACTRSNEPGQKGSAYEDAPFGAAPTASAGDLEYDSWVPFPSRTQYVRQLEKAAEGWRQQCESAREALTYAEDDLLTRAKHQRRDVWYWQGDGEDHPESMGRHMVVVIRAPDLQRLIRESSTKEVNHAQ